MTALPQITLFTEIDKTKQLACQFEGTGCPTIVQIDETDKEISSNNTQCTDNSITLTVNYNKDSIEDIKTIDCVIDFGEQSTFDKMKTSTELHRRGMSFSLFCESQSCEHRIFWQGRH